MELFGFIFIHVTLVVLIFTLLYVAKIRDRKQLHNAFIWMVLSLFVWTVGTIGLEYVYKFTGQTSAIMVSIAYIGIIVLPLTILYLGLTFAYTNIRLTWKFAPLLVVPITSVILLFTNNAHHLFYKTIEYQTLTRSEALGSYFLVHSIFSYGCILVGLGYLLLYSIKNSGFFSRQSIYIVLGITVSLLFNMLLTLQVIRSQFYTNLIAFFVAMMFIFLSIFKFNFLNVAPIALQRIVDHMSDAFVVLDDKNTIIDFNRTFVGFIGNLTPNLKRHNNFFDQMESIQASDIDTSKIKEYIEQATETGKATVFEQNIVTPAFTRCFTVEITPIATEHRILGTLILLKDITEQKNNMEAIAAHQQILLEQERLASLGQLIGGIAHNLKTPIMSLSGGLEALLDLATEYRDAIGDVQITAQDHREISDEMKVWIGKMQPYCSYMSDIISAVKGQAVQLTGDASYFTVDELLRRVNILMQHELSNHLCTLKIHSNVDEHIEITGEVQNLVQVFDNMIMNAMQAYAPNSGVIDIDIDMSGANLVFHIRDQAGGMPKTIADRLFREMVTTKGRDGTGLGLYMSHSMIRGAFGGTLTFSTEDGSGTSFEISIPVAGTDEDPANEADGFIDETTPETIMAPEQI